MNINNLLKPKCDTCNMLDIETNLTTAYANIEIYAREIEVTCEHMNICEMYKEFNNSEVEE